MKDEAKNLFNELISQQEPMLDEQTSLRIVECCEEYDLDPTAVFDWAQKVTIGHALLENVKERFLDVVSFENNEPAFRVSESGRNQVENILNRSPEGQRLVAMANEQKSEDDDLLSSRILNSNAD